MNKKFLKNLSLPLLLAVSLGISSNVLASHDFTHSNLDHTEACTIFLSADQHSDIQSHSHKIDSSIYLERLSKYTSIDYLNAEYTNYSTRAPPTS